MSEDEQTVKVKRLYLEGAGISQRAEGAEPKQASMERLEAGGKRKEDGRKGLNSPNAQLTQENKL